MLAVVVEKLQGVPDEHLVQPIRAFMNMFLVIEQLKKKKPDIDFNMSVKAINTMNQYEFRATMWDTSMYAYFYH